MKFEMKLLRVSILSLPALIIMLIQPMGAVCQWTDLPVATAVFNDTSLYVFSRFMDHHHYWNRFNGTKWRGWEQIPDCKAPPGNIGDEKDVADAAVVFDNTLYLFSVSSENHFIYMNSFNGNKWGEWKTIPMFFPTQLAPAVAVFKDYTGIERLYLFSIGTDKKHYMNAFDGQNWNPFGSEVPQGINPNFYLLAFLTDYADAATVFKVQNQDRLYLFGIGIDKRNYMTYTSDGLTWNGWEPVQAGGVYPSAGVTVSATVFNDKLYLFGRNSGLASTMTSFDGQDWSDWNLIPSGGNNVAPYLSDAATAFQNKLYIFNISIGFSNTINNHRYKKYLYGENWNPGWTALPEKMYAPPNDFDNDDIPDDVENELLARFRPYYRFTDGENHNPTDAVWFIKHTDLCDKKKWDPACRTSYECGCDACDVPHYCGIAGCHCNCPLYNSSKLQTKHDLILQAATKGYSDFRKNPKTTVYHINVDNSFRGGEQNWSTIEAEATGLYGHVAPIKDQCGQIAAYKIEYWQFYAHNDPRIAGEAYDHEGDWETVQLKVGLDVETIEKVRHEAHGTEMIFTVNPTLDFTTNYDTNFPGGVIMVYQKVCHTPGCSSCYVHCPGQGGLLLHLDVQAKAAQNNHVEFYCDIDPCTDNVDKPGPDKCRHPVVFIEDGGHASWPTGSNNWAFIGQTGHKGDSNHKFLVATPPNLGEIYYPNPNYPAANVILHYNGHWGGWAGESDKCNGDSPDGPSLHGSWGNDF